MKAKVLIIDAIGAETGIKEIDNITGVLAKGADFFELCGHDIQLSPLSEEQIIQADKIIISGSPFSAYDKKEWMTHIEAALTLILRHKKPTLAACFGAQFVAQFLGGSVIKNPAGTEFGSIKISLTDRGHSHHLLNGFHQSYHVHGSHNDYIASLPSGAELLAYNENSPIQAFQFESIQATQFHPDVPVPVWRQLLAGRKEKYFVSGFLKSQAHYDQVHEDLVYGESGHLVLRRFLEGSF